MHKGSSGLISAPSLREQARQVIRGLVITGQMQPDQLYSVPRLAAELGVSATPVREALLDLEREGLLEAERNRGFRVVSLSLGELNEIFAVRLLLEVPSVGDRITFALEATTRGPRAVDVRRIEDEEQLRS